MGSYSKADISSLLFSAMAKDSSLLMPLTWFSFAKFCKSELDFDYFRELLAPAREFRSSRVLI